MAITSLTIESEKLNPDNPSSIAIGEPLPYSVAVVTDSGGASGVVVLVSIRKVSDDSIVQGAMGPMQRRHEFDSIPADAELALDDAFEEETSSLLTTKGLELGSAGDGDGRYYLYAEIDGSPSINTGTALIFKVALTTVWMVLNTVFPGIPFVDANDEPLDEALIRRGIAQAIAGIERDMGFWLYPKSIKTKGLGSPNPTGYDLLRDPVTYKRDHFGSSPIKLRDTYVSSVSSLKLYYGSELIIDIPKEWINLRVKYGHIRLLYFANPVVSSPSNLFLVQMMSWRGRISDGWYVEYKSGWDETIEPFPADFLEAIEIYVTIRIATDWGDALNLGISNSSISMDGVSASLGRTASGVNGILATKLQSAKDRKATWFKMFSARYRPITIAFLGG